MSNLEHKGKKIELNEEGFMLNYADWSEEIASALAKQEEGIDDLTKEHWAVINFIRAHYDQKKLAPMVRDMCKSTGLPLRQIYELFPSGPAKGACKIAGLPKPDGCV